MLKQLQKEIIRSKLAYGLLLLIVLSAFYLRVYRIDQTLWFFFDQGRDAKVIWEFINNGKPFLIGPTTGIEGVFIGPFFYLLLIPGYFLSGGNPAGAAIFTNLLNSLGLIIVYYLGSRFSKLTGLIAAFIGAFSYNWIKNDRWLANPSPLSFFAPLTILLLYLSAKNPRKYFFWASFVAGLNLHLEASGSFFALLAIIIWVLVAKIYKDKWAIFLGGIGFFLTILPQILFELRHNFLITKNIINFVLKGSDPIQGKSFIIPDLRFLSDRIQFLYTALAEKIDINSSLISIIFITLASVSLTYKHKINDKLLFKLLIIWFITPILLMLFYRGHYGIVFAYYLNPVMPAFFILFSLGLVRFVNFFSGKILIAVFVLVFLYLQYPHVSGFLNNDLSGESNIALGNQIEIIDWVYQDAKGQEFDTDIYVPPVEAHAYEYLLLWYGKSKYGYLPAQKGLDRLYTIHEYDENKKRKEKWLIRQDSIGKIEDSFKIGGITAERRKRISE